MFWLPRGYLKAVYLFSNLHAEGFHRSVCAPWPCCDPGGTDSQAPHLMTEALPLLCHPLLSWAGTYRESPWRCRALLALEAAKATEGHSHGSDVSSTLPSPEGHSSLTGTHRRHSPLPHPAHAVRTLETKGTLTDLEHKYINF